MTLVYRKLTNGLNFNWQVTSLPRSRFLDATQRALRNIQKTAARETNKWQVAQNLTDKWYLRLVCLTDGWNDKWQR